jgi:hypothetical protein
MKTIPAMLTSTTLVLAFGNGAQAADKPAIVPATNAAKPAPATTYDVVGVVKQFNGTPGWW